MDESAEDDLDNAARGLVTIRKKCSSQSTREASFRPDENYPRQRKERFVSIGNGNISGGQANTRRVFLFTRYIYIYICNCIERVFPARGSIEPSGALQPPEEPMRTRANGIQIDEHLLSPHPLPPPHLQFTPCPPLVSYPLVSPIFAPRLPSFFSFLPSVLPFGSSRPGQSVNPSATLIGCERVLFTRRARTHTRMQSNASSSAT